MSSKPFVRMVALALALVCSAAAAAACGGDRELTAIPDVVATSRVEGDRIVVRYGDRDWDFLAGVNLGATIPGHSPGELAIGAETYRRWFPMISGLGFRVIRVYTIQSPAFYEEFRRYNMEHPDEPLFLLHGVWLDEERLLDTGDLYDEDLTNGFERELSGAVGAVTGSIEIPVRAGHASGRFVADASPWLIGWIIGIELDPSAVLDSDTANAGVDPYQGEMFRSAPGASPTESWLAARLDHLAAVLDDRGLAMPVAFTNWITTDPLTHPYEPLYHEDLVTVDPGHVNATGWDGGYFASYHAYPYYPDFLRFDPDLETRGGGDTYAGYLEELRDHHAGLPVLISEFGVPGGTGQGHPGTLGRTQGGHSEADLMAIDASLFDAIHDAGMAGGLLFEWADEWFKFTWNTIEMELPRERRAFWMNPWTNESHFGVLATEPGMRETIVLDDSLDDWSAVPSIGGSVGVVDTVKAAHDEGYLYLSIELADGARPNGRDVVVGFDVTAGGNRGLPGHPGVDTSADTAIHIAGDGTATALVRASNDPFGLRYLVDAGYQPVDPIDYVEGSGVWNVQHLLTSHPLHIRPTGQDVPAESYAVGVLIQGVTDPADPGFESRAAYHIQDGAIEMRIPYAAIGISDPSTLQALRVDRDYQLVSETFGTVGITIAVDDDIVGTRGYSWDPWDTVEWHERVKRGADVLQAALQRLES